MAKKKFHDEELPHELFTTTRQKTKIKNTFANNTSTDIKLSKAQLSKIIQWGRILFDLLGKLTGPMMKVYVPLGNFFFFFGTINYCGISISNRWCYSKKMLEKDVVKAEKRITWVILNEDMDDFIKITKSLGYSRVLNDGVSQTVRHWINKQEGGFLCMLLGKLGPLMLGNIFTKKSVMKSGRGYNNMDKHF